MKRVTDRDRKAAADSIRERIGRSLATLGFSSTRPGLWTREREHVVEFVRLHAIAEQASFRIHAGLRVLNDPSEHLALNGPDSDRFRGKRFGYRLEFDASEGARDACVADAMRFCLSIAEPWFEARRDARRLAGDPCLSSAARAALAGAIERGPEPARVALSRRLLSGP